MQRINDAYELIWPRLLVGPIKTIYTPEVQANNDEDATDVPDNNLRLDPFALWRFYQPAFAHHLVLNA